MLVECQDGKLLEVRNVVWLDIEPTAEGSIHPFRVTAQTVLDTTVEIFSGTESECAARLEEIEAACSEQDRILNHLCNGLAKRDDKMLSSIHRLMQKPR